jgi:UDP-glucose-4-epimerase GalE
MKMNSPRNPRIVLVSGGAGYIGSHVTLLLKTAGYFPIVIDNLSNGNLWATRNAAAFRRGDIGDPTFVRDVCREFAPGAALHFAAFIEVGDSVKHPAKYFSNNTQKAKTFFNTIAGEGVTNIVFSSTAAVYGEVGDGKPIRADHPTRPINPYGQSKLEAESYLRSIPNVASVTLRYFNVAGADPYAGLGEAHFPETHLIPRVVLPLINSPPAVLHAVGLTGGFTMFGTDYDTPDGTAVRDYIHVMDLADAHIRALRHLRVGGGTAILNLGSGSGYSVREIVEAARRVLGRPDFTPEVAPRRAGDPAVLIADSTKARQVLGWAPAHGIDRMIASAAEWHGSRTYIDTILKKAPAVSRSPAASDGTQAVL